MRGDADKLVKQQQSNIEKGIGKSYDERQKYAQRAGVAQDALNDRLASMGVDDFLEFMKTYAVDPAGAGHMKDVDLGPARTFVDKDTGETKVVPQRGRVIDVDASQASTTNTAITFGEYTTPTKKIGYAHFEKALDAGGKVRLAVETISKPHSFPIYYLPWASNNVLRLSIPPKGTAPTGVPDPDIFFTAGINGCSVFVEGTQQHPTIYHAGTEDKLGVNSGKFWRNLYREWSASAAVEPKGGKTFGEVQVFPGHAHVRITDFVKVREGLTTIRSRARGADTSLTTGATAGYA